MTAQELEIGLDRILDSLHGGSDLAMRQQLKSVAAMLAPTFQALPKNDLGRLAHPGVRHLVRIFFMRQHGIMLSGLEATAWQHNATQAHDMSILRQETLGAAEALLEAKRAGHGLALDDVAALVTYISGVIHRDYVELLEGMYDFLGVSMHKGLALPEASHLLTSFFLLFKNFVFEVSDVLPEKLEAVVQEQRVSTKPHLSSWDIMSDAVQNLAWQERSAANPFSPMSYSFEAMARAAVHGAERFGRLDTGYCSLLKQDLMTLDKRGVGLVPLGDFYAHKSEHSFHFEEDVDYLRGIGAIEESSAGHPQVRIVNYMVGPSNCFAGRPHFSVCCATECDALMSHLEHVVAAPAASPEELLGLVSNFSTATVDAPRRLAPRLVQKLDDIAAENGGVVPLHGRLFTQWLHLAFPHDCPFPHIAEDEGILTHGFWETHGSKVSDTDKEKHMRAAAVAGVEEDPQERAWVEMREALPMGAPQRWSRRTAGDVARIGMLLAMVGTVLRMLPRASAKGKSEQLLL